MKKWSLNRQELQAVWEALQICQQKLVGLSVNVHSDNTTVVSYLRRQGGTKSVSLVKLTGKIFHLAENNLCHLTATYIPGQLNIRANYLSRSKIHPGGVVTGSTYIFA